MGIENNTVSAKSQVAEYDVVRIIDKGANLNVLFVGNSITRHAPQADIGWDYDWGMAASSEETDYVHVTVKLLEEKYGKINFCTACCGDWERNYWDDDIIKKWQKARDFNADIIVIRIGENIWGQRHLFNEKPLYSHYDKMIKYFRSKENAKVIVTDLFWEDGGINKTVYKCVEENGYSLVKIGDIGEKDENKAIGKFWHSGVAIHPNDEGMRKIAERIADKILEK